MKHNVTLFNFEINYNSLPAFEISECENHELNSSWNWAFKSATYLEDVLKLLSKPSCYELLCKVSTLKSDITLKNVYLKTPSLHYEDNILEFEKSLEDSLRSLRKRKLISSSFHPSRIDKDDKVKSLIQPKRIFQEDRVQMRTSY